MLIVTGTKRSGTSMWMQILVAAGFPAFGEAFPSRWGETIRDANPSGFFESILRRGIYYRTNPHPQTGAYFFPEQVERHVVKVFIPGLVRTDRAFIGKVVATMRPWREYEASIARLYAMEDEQRSSGTPPARMPAHLEWWAENFALIRDIATRRYPVNVQSYDSLLADPDKVIAETLAWLGEGDIESARAAVQPEHRTQRAVESDSFEPEVATLCDELYETIDQRKALSPSLITKLNECDESLAPQILAARETLDRRPHRPCPGPPASRHADKGLTVALLSPWDAARAFPLGALEIDDQGHAGLGAFGHGDARAARARRLDRSLNVGHGGETVDRIAAPRKMIVVDRDVCRVQLRVQLRRTGTQALEQHGGCA